MPAAATAEQSMDHAARLAVRPSWDQRPGGVPDPARAGNRTATPAARDGRPGTLLDMANQVHIHQMP